MKKFSIWITINGAGAVYGTTLLAHDPRDFMGWLILMSNSVALGVALKNSFEDDA